MKGLIRSASLTNFADVARRVGLDPARLLREFGLPQQCLRDPELKVPLDTVRQLLEVSAERADVEAFGLMMADSRWLSNLGPVGLLVREQPTRASCDRRASAPQPATERSAVPDARGERPGRCAARGADRRPRGTGSPVDGARDRRGVPAAAHAAGTGLAPVARVLRARRAGRPLGARARVRPQRRVRPCLQRHRLLAQRPRVAESRRRSGDGALRAQASRDARR